MAKAVFGVLFYLAIVPNGLAYGSGREGAALGSSLLVVSMAQDTTAYTRALRLQSCRHPADLSYAVGQMLELSEDTGLARQRVAQAPTEVLPDDDVQPYNMAEVLAGLNRFSAFLHRYWSVFVVLLVFAGGVVSISLLRLCISLISATPGRVVKERALVCAWVCIPAAAMLIYKQATNIGFLYYIVGAVTLASIDAFGALVIGGGIRSRISKDWKPPNPLSLPLASVAFGVVAAVALLSYWIFGELDLSSCGPPPYPLASGCQFLTWLGSYLAAAVLLLIVACGAVLPANSNLVVAYHLIGRFIHNSIAALRARRRV